MSRRTEGYPGRLVMEFGKEGIISVTSLIMGSVYGCYCRIVRPVLASDKS